MTAGALRRESPPDSIDGEGSPVPRIAAGAMQTFVVKLRDIERRSWGDQTEVSATSALDAAEMVAGSRLTATRGERQDLRARVWATPFGSSPDREFYVDRSSQGLGLAGSVRLGDQQHTRASFASHVRP